MADELDSLTAQASSAGRQRGGRVGGMKRETAAVASLLVMLLATILLVLPAYGIIPAQVFVSPENNVFYTNATSVGYKFDVTVWVANVSDLYSFSVEMLYNSTMLNCTAAWQPYSDPMYVFYGKPTLRPPPHIDQPLGNVTIGDVILNGSSFFGTGKLCTIELQIAQSPPEGGILTCVLGITHTHLADSAGYTILAFTTNGNYEYATPPGPPVHDVAITSVRPSKTVIAQNQSMSVNVTAANQGAYTETFDTSAYTGTTSIATQTVTLSAGNSTTLTLTLDTSGLPFGNYTTWAYAWPVPNETDTTDNTLVDGCVIVTVPGDVVEPSFKVDMGDVAASCDAFGSTIGSDGNYWHKPPCILCPHSPNLDIDGEGQADMGDIVIALDHFGQAAPPPPPPPTYFTGIANDITFNGFDVAANNNASIQQNFFVVFNSTAQNKWYARWVQNWFDISNDTGGNMCIKRGWTIETHNASGWQYHSNYVDNTWINIGPAKPDAPRWLTLDSEIRGHKISFSWTYTDADGHYISANVGADGGDVPGDEGEPWPGDIKVMYIANTTVNFPPNTDRRTDVQGFTYPELVIVGSDSSHRTATFGSPTDGFVVSYQLMGTWHLYDPNSVLNAGTTETFENSQNLKWNSALRTFTFDNTAANSGFGFP